MRQDFLLQRSKTRFVPARCVLTSQCVIEQGAQVLLKRPEGKPPTPLQFLPKCGYFSVKILLDCGIHALYHMLVYQNLCSLRVYEGALFVEHIIVFKQVLTDIKVACFDLRLRALNTLIQPGMRDRFSWFHTHTAHKTLQPLPPKNAHKIIIQREKKF